MITKRRENIANACATIFWLIVCMGPSVLIAWLIREGFR